MDDSHVLSGESVSADASTKEEGDESENDVERVIPSLGKKSADILIDIDANRKKVITLDDHNKNLEEVFFKAIAEDATFKEYVDSAVVFQIFSNKFSTWVDLDRSKEISDGTHLKAIFRPKTDRGVGLCRTSKTCGEKRKYSDLSEDERCGSTSTQFDGQDEMKRGLPEQVSVSNSSPTISQGELTGFSLDMSGKNPVSALYELCTKYHWEAPQFALHEHSLISGVPEFLTKVTVRGHTYIPDTPSRKKQLSKTAAAEYCLKKLGILK